MENYDIPPKFKVLTGASSKGTQTKYFMDDYWYKTNNTGNEALAEELVSKVLKCSNIENYVEYERCMINGKLGCRSKNFLEKDESFLSFQRLYSSYAGGELNDKIKSIDSVKDRFEYLVDFLKETTGLDCSDYLKNTFAVDMLIKNPDRHFHNLGVIVSNDGTFREAPIFDNGQGLGQNFQITPPVLEIEEKEERLSAASISGSFEAQVTAAGNTLKINYDKLQDVLQEYENTPAKEFLVYQLEKYKKIFKEEPSSFEEVLF